MGQHISRRVFLGGALGAAGALAGAGVVGSAGRASAAPARDTVDAIVVGAGLSGLAAARNLSRAGASVVVLEARERPGGRIHNIRSAKVGANLDAGAEFVGPTQNRINALAREYDVRTIPTYNQGDSLYWHDGTGHRMSAAVPVPPVPEAAEALAALGRAQADALRGFPVGEPWKHPDAARLDSMSWKQYTDHLSSSRAGRALNSLALSAAVSARPDQVSALYYLNYIAAAGDEQNPGTLIRLLSTDDGAQERLFQGGAALIPIRMARNLGSRIVYNAPVRTIDTAGGRATVTTDAGTFTGHKVIVAMSPAIVDQIDFRPGLPATRIGLHRGYTMGAVSKFAALYRKPFWRENGMSGQVIGNGSPIDVTFEAATDGNHILMGFISADAMRRLDHASESQIVRECIGNFVDYFGPQAREHIDHGIFKWDLEPWSRGGPVATTRPGILTKYGPALRTPVGPIHWAGTETADFWTGYMDGAVRSGERAAREVLDALR